MQYQHYFCAFFAWWVHFFCCCVMRQPALGRVVGGRRVPVALFEQPANEIVAVGDDE